MNITELRINNWVLSKDKPIKVESIDIWSGGINYELVSDYYDAYYNEWISSIEPIPLTPDILEKAGFIFSEYYQEYYYKLELNLIFELEFVKDSWYPVLHNTPEFSQLNEQVIGLNRIKYVHQLQNLIFALTGKELNIQL